MSRGLKQASKLMLLLYHVISVVSYLITNRANMRNNQNVTHHSGDLPAKLKTTLQSSKFSLITTKTSQIGTLHA